LQKKLGEIMGKSTGAVPWKL